MSVDAELQVGPYWWVAAGEGLAAASPSFDTAEQARAYWDELRARADSDVRLAVVARKAGLDVDDLITVARDHATLVCNLGVDNVVPIEGYWYDPETKGWREEA